MFICRRGASAPNLVFTRTLGDAACLARITGYQNCIETGDPIDGTPTSNTLGANSATVTTGAITTTVDGAMLHIAFCGADNTTASGYTTAETPYVFTEIADSATTQGADTTLAIANARKFEAGSTGTIQCTAGNSSRHVMMAVALKPKAIAPIAQTVTAWSDTSITITAVRDSGLDIGDRFLFVTNDSAVSNSAGAVVTLKGQERFVNTASAGGGNGTTNGTGSGGNNACATLNAWIQLQNAIGALTDVTTVYCEGTAADTVANTSGSFTFTTTSDNYLAITVAPGNRHSGVFSTSHYRITVTDDDALYSGIPCHMRVSWLQFETTVTTSATSYSACRLSSVTQDQFNCDLRTSNCISKAVYPGGAADVVALYRNSIFDPAQADGTSRHWNNIAIGASHSDGFGDGDEAVQYYNCSGIGGQSGFIGGGCLVNCLASGASISDFLAITNVGHRNNASSDASAEGTNSLVSQTFVFVNAGAGNYQLVAASPGTDAGLLDAGSGLFSDDIAGTTRVNPWDIGAFKAAP